MNFRTLGLRIGDRASFACKSGQVGTDDEAAHAVADKIDLGNQSSAGILDHVEKLPQRHAQFFDGAAVDRLLDAIVEEIDRRRDELRREAAEGLGRPRSEIGHVLGGITEICHPFNSTTGGVEPPDGTTGKASTVTVGRRRPLFARIRPTADTVTAYSPAFIVSEAASMISSPLMLGPTANPLPCAPTITAVRLLAFRTKSSVSAGASIAIRSPACSR